MDKFKAQAANVTGKLKINNPIPYEGLAADCAKAATILDHFIKGENPMDATLIPTAILKNAVGIAVITVIKVGFVWTGKVGSGVVVARLPDGRWSAPSSIAMSGVGFGAQIGAQLTDFVFVLNTAEAVKAFSHGGNVTLGAQVGIAAGPVGRAVEGGGSVINFAPIYTYAKNQGLFAGLSLEGSVIVARNDANAEFYHQKVTPKQLLSGLIEPPSIADPLYRALNIRFGEGVAGSPSLFTNKDKNQFGGAYPTGTNTNAYKPPPEEELNGYRVPDEGGLEPSSNSSAPGLPTRAKSTNSITAIALYDFKGERPDDLPFKKGDIITVIKKTDSTNDWWTGRVGNKQGDFPANYVTVRQ
ncbi:hypothetical protein HK098_001232 [Nowakowskiella sp. JEL0407]|nr:hypothetical protein HK098_001232 [Nowakowskiella sp. JEL0407]